MQTVYLNDSLKMGDGGWGGGLWMVNSIPPKGIPITKIVPSYYSADIPKKLVHPHCYRNYANVPPECKPIMRILEFKGTVRPKLKILSLIT